MEKEIIIVPTYKREELLFLCLEAIRAMSDLPVWVFSDRGYSSRDLGETCHKFNAEWLVIDPHNSYGNSLNVMTAMRWAATKAEITHLVEDDTIVHRDWFAWARLALETKHYAAVCAGIHHAPNWYTSPCVSWDSDKLRQALQAVPANYLAEENREAMQRGLDEKFPDSAYRKGGAEQDGFFLRAIESFGWNTTTPAYVMASHIGWFGYNQPPGRPGPEGTFEKRIEVARGVLGDLGVRRLLFGHRIADAEWSGQRVGNNREAVMRAANEEQG